MALKPHEQRVVTERDQLSEKHDRLFEFLQTDTFNGLRTYDQLLLTKQLTVMAAYRDILDQRIERFA